MYLYPKGCTVSSFTGYSLSLIKEKFQCTASAVTEGMGFPSTPLSMNL